MMDENGNVVWQADYKPFGAAEITVNAVSNDFRFPGQSFDQETGLHYNYHRYYDPNTGRYLTPDPIGLLGGVNIYTYADNNSMTHVDPFGLSGFGIEVGGGVGAGGFKDEKSKADNAATGLYIGAKPGGHAELGAYTYKEKTKIGGAKLGLGFTFLIYWKDAEKFFKGLNYIKSVTLGPVTQTWHYDECGKEIGRSFSIFGKGGGISFEEGESQSVILPLQ